MNSVAVALLRLKADGAEAGFRPAEDNDQLRIPYALYRLIWLLLDQDPRFISIPADPKNMPLSLKFYETYGSETPDSTNH